ncbi:Lipid A export ATP-binding/permease protein MsbA [Roseivivax sp. THAF40]|uniref:ABC transporter ATP-binding protein n=1 Tax=unclassified Roseivivax TaxID=2639302 RepID=UPI00126921C1|nr:MULTISPECIES: ABC transporter ATP-binding protein [unclassified Roseivivax]QFS82627.1 Lipid A export ATP-binding/permease protein MsbA [Roseivivax sp. THAF197b]QFT46396.1 Lipid A export ATP-binding/permease protein MsbA [Roseivivax sp. THAF40]
MSEQTRLKSSDEYAAGEDNTFRERVALFGWIWRDYLIRHWPWFLVAFILMTLEGAMFGALSYMMKPMFDQVFVEGGEQYIGLVGIAFFSIFTIRALAGIGQKTIMSRVSAISMMELREALLRHIMTLDGGFHQTYGPGYLMQRLNGDVNTINTLWKAFITGAGRDVVALISLFGVAFAIDWRWTLIALVGAPLLIMPAFLLQRVLRGNSRRVRDMQAGLSTRLNEVFTGIVPVKLNTLEQYQADRFRSLSERVVGINIRNSAAEAAIPGLIDIMSGMGFAAVLYFGGGEILSGDKTVGDFVAFFTAIGLAFEPLRRLGGLSGKLQPALAGLERLRELFDLKPAVTDPDHPVPAPTAPPRIAFDSVTASYGDGPILQETSFVAEAGKVTALVGPSGAGKSTVFNLLTRLLDPENGTVTLDGIRTEDMALADLRAIFSVVSQDALLFDESLRDNILLGQDHVSEARLQAALDAARVTDFLPKLQGGLDATVGPRGSKLSGGQRQRVAIARAILRDTPVLLLDEATSALDAQIEADVQAALDQLARQRTTLIIAHRLSTIRGADKIVVMNHGRAVQQGTHEALLREGGLYADLHNLQIRDAD